MNNISTIIFFSLLGKWSQDDFQMCNPLLLLFLIHCNKIPKMIQLIVLDPMGDQNTNSHYYTNTLQANRG